MFDDSDYIVEQYIKPNKVFVPLINDERADLLGNFEDEPKEKRKKKKPEPIAAKSEENTFDDQRQTNNENENTNNSGEDESGSEMGEDDQVFDDIHSKIEDNSVNDVAKDDIPKTVKSKKNKPKKTEKSVDLTDDQMKALIRGSSKQDRFVLYVTNLNYLTTRDGLTDFFSTAGTVKSVRIPKVRRSAFAFVEMNDINGFKNALALHNRPLDDYTIKVQISEAGKKKSANKKNILKQKNRKLAEMRNESKQFQRSGKGYDKTIKKEIKQRKMLQDRRLARKNRKNKN